MLQTSIVNRNNLLRTKDDVIKGLQNKIAHLQPNLQPLDHQQQRHEWIDGGRRTISFIDEDVIMNTSNSSSSVPPSSSAQALSNFATSSSTT